LLIHSFTRCGVGSKAVNKDLFEVILGHHQKAWFKSMGSLLPS